MFLLGVTQCTLIGLLGPVGTHQKQTSCHNEAMQGSWHVSAASLDDKLDLLQLVSPGVTQPPQGGFCQSISFSWVLFDFKK